MIELRPYQKEAVKAVHDRFAQGDRATLLSMATGTGKTTVFGEIARKTVEKGNNVLVLAHRDELISQAAQRMSDMCGVDVGVEKASDAYDYESPVCVASVQTLRGKRLERLSPGCFGLTIVDEAHHSVSDSYLRILDHFDSHVLGVTATPDRADKKALSTVFDSIAYEYGLAKAIEEGYLCPIRSKFIPLKIDISSVKMSHGDWQARDLGNKLDAYLHEIAQVMKTECAGRKTLVFLPLVETARKMSEELKSASINSEYVHGADPDREEKIERFKNGETDVLCNAMLLTEGWNCPSVDCIVVLRPTKSRALYSQMIGRGTRLSPETGKDHLLLLDFLWMTARHNLCRPASLLGKEADVAGIMQDIAEEGEEYDLMEAASAAEEKIMQRRGSTLADTLHFLSDKKKATVNPLDFALCIQNFELADYSPIFKWELREPTYRQLQALINFGIDIDSVDSFGMASKLLNVCVGRANRNLATAKQIKCLAKFGFKNAASWGFNDASDMISAIADNGWEVPPGINPDTFKP